MTRNDRGEPVEKRWVKFPGALGHGYYDPAAIPPEWNQWLNRVREEPPTEEDITQCGPRLPRLACFPSPVSAALRVRVPSPWRPAVVHVRE